MTTYFDIVSQYDLDINSDTCVYLISIGNDCFLIRGATLDSFKQFVSDPETRENTYWRLDANELPTEPYHPYFNALFSSDNKLKTTLFTRHQLNDYLYINPTDDIGVTPPADGRHIHHLCRQYFTPPVLHPLNENRHGLFYPPQQNDRRLRQSALISCIKSLDDMADIIMAWTYENPSSARLVIFGLFVTVMASTIGSLIIMNGLKPYLQI